MISGESEMGERDRPRAYPLYFHDQFFQQFVPALSLFLPLTYIISCQGTKLGRSHKSKGYVIIIIQMRVWQWIGSRGVRDIIWRHELGHRLLLLGTKMPSCTP